MLHNILVCLDYRPENVACQELGFYIARSCGGSVDGLYAIRPSDPLSVMGRGGLALSSVGGAPMNYWIPEARMLEELQRSADEERAQADLVLDHFKARARDRGVSVHGRIEIGDPAEAIAEASKAYDLAVIGRGAGRGQTLLGSVTREIVTHVITPVLVVPDFSGSVNHILVAYDGSAGSRRALSCTADLWMRWKGEAPAVLLAAVKSDASEGDEMPSPARSYLTSCKIPYREFVEAGRPADVIERLVAEEKVDMVCMGGYGHNMVREVLLGSTTQHLLGKLSVPMLLCH